MFTGFGELGVSRRKVASIALNEANRFYASSVAVDSHLADQDSHFTALAGGGSFTTTEPSLHTRTNLRVIEISFCRCVLSALDSKMNSGK